MNSCFCLVRKVIRTTLLVGGLLLPWSSYAGVPDEIKKLIEQKRVEDAYQLGLKHPELLGDPYFDYVFGSAAVDAGRPSVGVLALERVLLSNPNNDVARLELGRAYFVLGENQRAREEFEEVKRKHPPAGVVATINIYLDAIKDKESAFKINGSVFAEIGGGWNSNVNTATAVNNILLPIFGPVQLTGNSKPQASGFSFLNGGGTINAPMTRDITAFASVNAMSQRYAQYDGYDMGVTNGMTGVKITDGPNLYKISAFGSVAKMDQVPVPNTAGGGVEYDRQLTETQSVSMGYGYSNLSYAQQYSAYDSGLNAFSLGYRKVMPTTTWKPVVDVMLNAAKQNNRSTREDLARNIWGGGLQLSMLPAERWGVSTGIGYTNYNYIGQDLLYLQGRSDNLFSANGVLQYKLDDGWSTRLELTYYNNQSNLNLYSYQQFTAALKLRFDWNSK